MQSSIRLRYSWLGVCRCVLVHLDLSFRGVFRRLDALVLGDMSHCFWGKLEPARQEKTRPQHLSAAPPTLPAPELHTVQ